MSILSADQIFSAPIPTREVDVPEWGGSVLIRSLSPRSRIAIVGALVDYQNKLEAYEADQKKSEEEREGIDKPEAYDDTILAVMFAIVDKNMNLMFTMAHYERFLELPYPTIQYIYKQMIMLEARAVEPPAEQKKSLGKARKSASSSV